jgi:hypothetical protein
MSAKRHSIQASFKPINSCYEEQVRRLACASGILARGQARRKSAMALKLGIGVSSYEPTEAKNCLPVMQESKTNVEKTIP